MISLSVGDSVILMNRPLKLTNLSIRSTQSNGHSLVKSTFWGNNVEADEIKIYLFSSSIKKIAYCTAAFGKEFGF